MRTAVGCGLMLCLFVGVATIALCSYRRANQAENAARGVYWKGHRAYDAGRYLEAMEHYRECREWAGRGGRFGAELTGSIADCLARTGQYEAALVEFDAALSVERLWYVCVNKAHCLAQRDPVAALAWLKSEPLTPVGSLAAVSFYHRQRSEHAEARDALIAWLDLLNAEQCFDTDNRLVGFDIPFAAERHSELASILDPLQQLAECQLQLGQLELAEVSAVRGLAVRQRMQEPVSYIDGATKEAGSLPCRLVLARVHMQRGNWIEADKQLRHAEWLAEHGWVGDYKQVLSDVQAQMQEHRD